MTNSLFYVQTMQFCKYTYSAFLVALLSLLGTLKYTVLDLFPKSVVNVEHYFLCTVQIVQNHFSIISYKACYCSFMVDSIMYCAPDRYLAGFLHVFPQCSFLVLSQIVCELHVSASLIVVDLFLCQLCGVVPLKKM